MLLKSPSLRSIVAHFGGFSPLKRNVWSLVICISVFCSPAALKIFEVISLGSTVASWAEGSSSCCLWAQQPTLEEAMKAPAPLLLHDSCSSSYLQCPGLHAAKDGEEEEHGGRWRRSLSWARLASSGLARQLSSHPARWRRAPPAGCRVCAEASWLWRRNGMVGWTVSVWRGRPSQTWFPDHLEQVTNWSIGVYFI